MELMQDRSKPVRSVAYSTDGNTLFVASDDMNVMLYDVYVV